MSVSILEFKGEKHVMCLMTFQCASSKCNDRIEISLKIHLLLLNFTNKMKFENVSLR